MVESMAMKPAKAALSREQWAALILGMTGLFGLITRLFPALITGFPLNDGGMFLVMIRDLRLNGFLLPAYTSYNFGEIPFAYPPLGLYIAGILSWIGLPELELLRWLPILFNLGACTAFFFLAKALLKDTAGAAAATMIYTLVPDSFTWQIMGGGLTRALGMACLILAQYFVIQMFRKDSRAAVLPAMLFCALAVLSHPEVALAAASSCALIWLFFGRNREGGIRAVLAGGGTLVLTFPWWGNVLASHGFAPFQNVLHSGMYDFNPLVDVLGMFNPAVAWTGIFHVLTLVGTIWNLARRRWFLPLWLVLPFLVEPRSAGAYAYIPAVIMAVQSLTEALPAAIERFLRRDQPGDAKVYPFDRQAVGLLVFGLGILWFVQSAFYGGLIHNTSLLPPWPQQTMAWVEANTRPDSRFLLLTGNGGSMTDPLQEWFPALANRRSQTTLQGQEWMLGEWFFPRVGELASLQACEDAACIERWSYDSQLNFSHLMLERNAKTDRLIGSLRGNSHYEEIYENAGYVIFER